MRNILVRVVDSSGRPAQSQQVSLWVYQFLAGGVKDQQTDSSGEAMFNLDIDEGAEISVSVNGKEYFSRGSIKSHYSVHL